MTRIITKSFAGFSQGIIVAKKAVLRLYDLNAADTFVAHYPIPTKEN
jgi:hypothetical protein